MNPDRLRTSFIWKPMLIGGGTILLYAGVLASLARDWWFDENYSHGLLVPGVIALILWRELPELRTVWGKTDSRHGIPVLLFALALLLLGSLGAESYLQRLSLVILLSAIVVCFFGKRLLLNLWLPLLLLVFSIPIPQLLFNKIAFPLQLWASRIAELCMWLVGVPLVRSGNVIELVPLGATQVVALEVVEACSGIRSMMTLATLALLLAYFTTNWRKRVITSPRELMRDPLVWRSFILVILAVPIALVTNALRVAGTGVITYYYGLEVADGAWHGISGLGVFIFAFVLLACTNFILMKLYPTAESASKPAPADINADIVPKQMVLAIFTIILSAGVLVTWLEFRGEAEIVRRQLTSFPIYLDGTTKVGADTRLPEATENVLGVTDYVMRDYRTPSGQRLNLYIGYYKSQRTGATYHSPRNCLPGSGWELSDLGSVDITTASGKTFTANKYLVSRGDYKGLMIYWYQGRGRTNSSEYWDKMGTIVDSILLNRSDGAMIRIMGAIGSDEQSLLDEATSFTSAIATRLPLYVPN